MSMGPHLFATDGTTWLAFCQLWDHPGVAWVLPVVGPLYWLIAEVSERARVKGWRVVRVTAVEAESSFSLAGLNQMVMSMHDVIDGLTTQDRLVLAPVLGGDSRQEPSPIPLAVALVNLLRAAAQSEPVLMAVDDVHWLDPLSATTLSAAGRRVSDPNVRIVSSYRPLWRHVGPP
jgi:hypothetical protein